MSLCAYAVLRLVSNCVHDLKSARPPCPAALGIVKGSFGGLSAFYGVLGCKEVRFYGLAAQSALRASRAVRENESYGKSH